MALNQWLVYARFDAKDRQWHASVGDREVVGSMHDIVIALNAANYRIISAVATTMDTPLATAGADAREDAYVKGYSIFVEILQ